MSWVVHDLVRPFSTPRIPLVKGFRQAISWLYSVHAHSEMASANTDYVTQAHARVDEKHFEIVGPTFSNTVEEFRNLFESRSSKES